MKQNQKRRIKCLLAAFCLSLGLLGAATASAFEAETVEPISEAPVVQDKENTALQSASLLSADTGILYGCDGGSAVITAADGFSVSAWSFDTGYSEALVRYDGNCATVSANGYAGIVKVTASGTFNGEAYIESTEICILGGKKAKPGLNLFTGTPEVLDFESIDDDMLSHLLQQNNGWTLSQDPLGEGKAVKAPAGGWAPFYLGKPLPDGTFEPERPMDFKADILKGGTDLFVWLNDMSVGYTTFGGSDGAWFTSHRTVNLVADWKNNPDEQSKYESFGEKGFTFITFAAMSDISADGYGGGNYLYTDNYSLIPYYKITYVKSDGSQTAVYVLYDGNGSLITSYTPDKTLLDTEFYEITVNGKTAVYPVSEPIPLAHEDVVITAYPAEKPITSDETSIRVTGVAGIRFKAKASNATLLQDNVEIGFLATRSNETIQGYMEELSDGELTMTCVENEFALKGVAYKKADGVQVGANHLSEDGDGIYSSFTVCVTGIPKKYYTENVLVRPYVTIGETTYYGAAKEQSLYEAAKSYPDAENETVKEILAAGE